MQIYNFFAIHRAISHKKFDLLYFSLSDDLRQLLQGIFGEAALHLQVYHIGQPDGIVGHEPPGVITNGYRIVCSQVGSEEDVPVGFERLGGDVENEVAPLTVHSVADGPHPPQIPLRLAIAKLPQVDP